MADKNIDQSILADIQDVEKESGQKIIDEKEALITPEIEAELEEEIELEEKYGDSEVRTFAESAASGASFGLSDQILTKAGLVSEEDLRERRKRNKASAIAGEVTGIAAPMLLSGGSSILAKAAASGVKTAAKAGQVVEKLTAKGLNKLIAETGKKSLAKEVLRKGITKGAGSAVEGSFYGTGKLISEEALGNADFNAENFISHAGTGAMFGGALGSTLGALQVVAPVIKGNKITGWVSKKVKGSTDPAKNAQQLAGVSPSKVYKMKEFSRPLYEHTPLMLKSVANKKGIGAFSSNTKLHGAIKEYIKDTGVEIGKTLDDVSGILQTSGSLPTRSAVAQKMVTKLDDLTNQFKDANGKILAGAAEKVRKINRTKKALHDDLLSNKIMTTKEINALKSKYQKLAKWDRKGNLALEESINREMSRALREQVMELAEKAGGPLGKKLEKQMLDYGAATEFAGNFGQHIDKQSMEKFVGFKDILLGGMFGKTGLAISAAKHFVQSDLKKKLIILTDIEKANAAVSKKLNSGVTGFLKGKIASKVSPTPIMTKTLLNSQLAYESKDGVAKKPKNEKEAFKNMQKNLEELQDPEKLYEATNIEKLSDAAPLAASQSQQVMARSIQFLLEKIPKSANPTGLFAREYTPSTIEISKFKRYVRAVENPLTLLEDMKNGTVTSEGVEAVQEVYPNLYQRIQQSVIEQIAEDPEAVSYEKRLSLGILLNMPTEGSLTPESIRGLQSHFSEAQESQSGGAISASKAAEMDLAQSEATDVQRVSNRKDLE